MSNKKLILASGALSGVYNALTFGFISVFALALGASNLTIGVLGALPFAATILSQIPGAKVTEYFKRKTIYVAFATFARFSWIFILMLPFFIKTNALLFLMISLFLINFLEFSVDPAWTSLVADLVPEKERGRFFGKRLIIYDSIWMVATLLGGIYLDAFPKQTFTGFSTMFLAGLVFGILATFVLSKVKEPDTIDRNHHRSLKDFFSMPKTLKRFCISQVFFNFAYMLASPFFTVYMIQNLGMSYTLYFAASSLTILTRLLAERHIGKVSDRYGDKPLAIISIIGTALVPLMYIFTTKETLWLIIPAQIISGYVWGAFDLTRFNLLLDLTDKRERPMQVAEFTLVTSVPLIIAPIVGGIIADKARFILAGIPLLFAISFVLRALSPLLLIGIRESRAKQEYPLGIVFREAVTFHPAKGAERIVKVIFKKIKRRVI